MHPLHIRAQDKATMQLSELEEEMDQRIQAAEHKTWKDVSVGLTGLAVHSATLYGALFMDKTPSTRMSIWVWVQQIQAPTNVAIVGFSSGGVFWSWSKKKVRE